MASTLGGDDPLHDLDNDEKDRIEVQLRADARDLKRRGRPKDAKKKDNRASEISREKSKKAHKGAD